MFKSLRGMAKTAAGHDSRAYKLTHELKLFSLSLGHVLSTYPLDGSGWFVGEFLRAVLAEAGRNASAFCCTAKRLTSFSLVCEVGLKDLVCNEIK